MRLTGAVMALVVGTALVPAAASAAGAVPHAPVNVTCADGLFIHQDTNRASAVVAVCHQSDSVTERCVDSNVIDGVRWGHVTDNSQGGVQGYADDAYLYGPGADTCGR